MNIKKIITNLLILTLILVSSTSIFAQSNLQDENNFKLITKITSDSIEKVSEELISSKSYSNGRKIVPYGSVGEKTFLRKDKRYNQMTLYAMNINGNRVPVGTHEITIYYKWYETWIVDTYGNKIRLISSTRKKIYDALRDYHSIVGWTINENSWDEGIGKNRARGYGNVTFSKGGTEAGTHTLYTP